MTKKSRTILFSGCVFLFLLIAPSMVYYSQGYRFDFADKKVTQTGGLFLKILPKQVDIYLNGAFKKKTDFFFGSTLVENLIPKKYKIEVKKDGYYTWEKTLEIKEKEVTEAKSIILFPQNQDFTILANNIENFWLVPDGKKIILEEKDSSGWSLKIYDLNKNVKSQITSEKNISRQGAQLLKLDFSPDSTEIYISVGIKEQIKTFTINYNETSPALNEKASTTITDNVITYKKIKNETYYLDSSGYVLKSDPSFVAGEKMNSVPFPVKQETEYNIEVFSGKIFLKEDQILFLLNPSSGSFEKFLEPIKEIKVSPDPNKILLFSENEIWIWYLNGSYTLSVGKKEEEKIFLTRFSEKINDVFWINSDYIAFIVGDKLKIAETDDRDKINIYDLGEFSDPKMYFNQADGKIYVLSEKNIKASKNILP
jgi:hypothetical protein